MSEVREIKEKQIVSEKRYKRLCKIQKKINKLALNFKEILENTGTGEPL